MRKFISVLMLLIMLVTLSSCGASSGPQQAANGLVKGMKNYDIDIMKEYVTQFPSISRELLTYDLFSDANYTELFRKAYKDAKISIDVTTKSDVAAVGVCKVTSPDLSGAYASAMYTVTAQIFSDESLYALVQDEDADLTGLIPQQMIKMLDEKSIETTTREYTVSLKNENGVWKIVDDDNFRLFLTSDLYQTVKNTIEGMTSEDDE